MLGVWHCLLGPDGFCGVVLARYSDGGPIWGRGEPSNRIRHGGGVSSADLWGIVRWTEMFANGAFK